MSQPTNPLADVVKDLEALKRIHDTCYCDDVEDPIMDSRVRCASCTLDSAIARLQELQRQQEQPHTQSMSREGLYRQRMEQQGSGQTEIRELLERFIRWTAFFAHHAGSAWADEIGISQECHWLNEATKDAQRALAAQPSPDTLDMARLEETICKRIKMHQVHEDTEFYRNSLHYLLEDFNKFAAMRAEKERG